MILLVTNVRISAKTPSYRFPRDSISLVKHFWICVRPNYENRTSHLLGWVWEPYHSLWVTGAYKDDKAEIDLSLWVFGGDITEMEIEGFSIRNFLLRCWKRRLYLEAICWSKNQDPIEYNINVVALYDALTRAMHYSWWEWLDGSRLFLWRWPLLWMKVSRYGARAFHLYFTPPNLRFYSSTIK